MRFKELVKTKTFWSGIALVVYGIVRIAGGDSEGIQDVIIGLAVIFLRDAMLKDERTMDRTSKDIDTYYQ